MAYCQRRCSFPTPRSRSDSVHPALLFQRLVGHQALANLLPHGPVVSLYQELSRQVSSNLDPWPRQWGKLCRPPVTHRAALAVKCCLQVVLLPLLLQRLSEATCLSFALSPKSVPHQGADGSFNSADNLPTFSRSRRSGPGIQGFRLTSQNALAARDV